MIHICALSPSGCQLVLQHNASQAVELLGKLHAVAMQIGPEEKLKACTPAWVQCVQGGNIMSK